MLSVDTALFLFALLAIFLFLWTERLATPKTELFPFPIPFKIHRLTNALFLFSAFLSYWRPEVVVTIVTAALLIAGRNATLITWVRGLGEEGVLKLGIENATKERFWPGLLVRILPAVYYGLLAVFIFLFFPTIDTWGFWIALGVVCHSFSILIGESLGFLRYRKLGRAAPQAT